MTIEFLNACRTVADAEQANGKNIGPKLYIRFWQALKAAEYQVEFVNDSNFPAYYQGKYVLIPQRVLTQAFPHLDKIFEAYAPRSGKFYRDLAAAVTKEFKLPNP